MRALCRWIDRVNAATGTVAAWLIAPLIGAMCYEVAARYLFNAPTIWAYELAYLLTGSGWLLGMAYTLSRGAHIRIDVLYVNLRPRGQALVDLAGYVLLLLPFILWLTSTLDDRAIAAFQSGEKTGQSAWNPPLWPFRAVFFVSFALLALQVVGEILRKLPVVFGRAGAGAR
ncbi:MAG: TRAP transporter small permease subunit [Alphaproteobacteria bacterium]|nr:TRAP transporter small permease subunit [Alphaproteobacteria bacterium]